MSVAHSLNFIESFNSMIGINTSYQCLQNFFRDVAGQFKLPLHTGEVLSKISVEHEQSSTAIYLTNDVGTGALKIEYIKRVRDEVVDKRYIRTYGQDSQEAREMLRNAFTRLMFAI